MTAATETEQLLSAMAAALADEQPGQRYGVVALEDLERIVQHSSRAAVVPLAADLVGCWRVYGREAPASIAVLAPANVDPVALSTDAEALEAIRNVASALLADDVEGAGRLLRGLVAAPTAYDRLAVNAIGAASANTRQRMGALVQVLAAHRTFQARVSKQLGGPVPPSPPPAAVVPRPARIEVVDAAIEWFVRQKSDFVIGDRSLKNTRKLGELGVLADVLLRFGPTRNRPEWMTLGRELLEYAWDQLERGGVLVEMIELHPEMSINVTVYWLFHRHGLRNEALAAAIAKYASQMPRRIAYLGACAMKEIGLTPPWPIEETFQWTVVGQTTPPWRLLPIEVYLVTHVAFYNARFGDERRPFPGREYLRLWLPVWLQHFQRIGAHDLLAEMIFTWHCVEDICCHADAWQTLVDAQAPDGHIPFSRDTPGDDYHSTLMTITAALQCSHH